MQRMLKQWINIKKKKRNSKSNELVYARTHPNSVYLFRNPNTLDIYFVYDNTDTHKHNLMVISVPYSICLTHRIMVRGKYFNWMKFQQIKGNKMKLLKYLKLKRSTSAHHELMNKQIDFKLQNFILNSSFDATI